MEIKDIGKSCGTVYHYTKLQSAIGIIRKEGIVLHAGRYDAMNDPEDSVYGALTTVKDLGIEVAEQIADIDTYNISPYLVSFCKENDLPLMWRLYDAEITLHIDSEKIMEYCQKSSKNMYMNSVDYVPQEKVSKRVYELFPISKKIFPSEELDFEAKVKSSFIKPDDFTCEQEWRIACFDDYNTMDDNSCPNKLDGDTVASEIKVKSTRLDVISFYRELKFPKECLIGITIRAYEENNFWNIRSKLRIWLAQSGYDLNRLPIYKTKTHRVR